MHQFKIDEDDDKSGNTSSHTRIRNLEILPKKCELLRSDDTTKQLEAAVYFRRILAAGNVKAYYNFAQSMTYAFSTQTSFLP